MRNSCVGQGPPRISRQWVRKPAQLSRLASLLLGVHSRPYDFLHVLFDSPFPCLWSLASRLCRVPLHRVLDFELGQVEANCPSPRTACFERNLHYLLTRVVSGSSWILA